MENTKNISITKELEPIKIEIERVESFTTTLEIKTPEDLKGATDELGIVKKVQKQLDEKKEGITKPLMAALKNVRALFAPLETKIDAAEQIIKQKMVAYQTAAEKKAEKKAEKITAAVDLGTLSFDQGTAKLAKVATPEKTVSTEAAQVTFRIVKKVVVENPELLPREYLVPDLVRIRADALAGKQISGVKVVEEKVVSAR